MKDRIEAIDTLRGAAIIVMIINHIIYDAVYFLGASPAVFDNPLAEMTHLSAHVFIILSGVCCSFSRSNVKRGAKVFLIAMVITVVTGAMDMIIRFGVLHLLGFCMIFYGLTHKLWEDLPPVTAVLFFALFLITKYITDHAVTSLKFLWMFGFTYPGFYSADYFPIFPWLFLFLTGAVLGRPIKEGKFPEWFYKIKSSFLSLLGRHSLLIYVVHQPVLYGICFLIQSFMK